MIRRDAAGRWFDGDQPITHPRIAAAFDRWIDRAPGGGYCLRNSINSVPIIIEGAPIFVRAVRCEPGGVELSLSDGRAETLDPETLHLDQDGALSCEVHDRGFPARFDRNAAFALADFALREAPDGLYFELSGFRVKLAG